MRRLYRLMGYGKGEDTVWTSDTDLTSMPPGKVQTASITCVVGNHLWKKGNRTSIWLHSHIFKEITPFEAKVLEIVGPEKEEEHEVS